MNELREVADAIRELANVKLVELVLIYSEDEVVRAQARVDAMIDGDAPQPEVEAVEGTNVIHTIFRADQMSASELTAQVMR